MNQYQLAATVIKYFQKHLLVWYFFQKDGDFYIVETFQLSHLFDAQLLY